MLELTKQAAKFASEVKMSQLPPRCAEAITTGITDCVGVMIAGAGEEAVQIVAGMVSAATGKDTAPEIPSGRKLSSADAALVNGVAAHALDYDDVALSGHPSTVLVPAILAEGWTLGSSGADVIAAYAAGYEIWALLEALEPGAYHERGFHPTAILGTVATAAACARLHGYDSGKTAHAIAIGASLASGLVANFGTMTKPLHAGRSAQSGIIAARLAGRGFTGALDVLEHRTGFMRAHSPSSDPQLDAQDAGLGTHWRLPQFGINVKRYPACYGTHRAIDAMIELAREHNLTADAVKEIRVRTGSTQKLMLRNSNPQTGLEAKFSMEFALSAALVVRRVGLAELTDEFVRRPDVAANFAKVKISVTEEKAELDFAPDDRVSVLLTNGAVLEHAPVTDAKGSWKRPMNRDEFEEKFLDCATRRLDRGHASELFEQLWSIAKIASVRDLHFTQQRVAA
ncbi:MAG: MmgE/PrpD family protein [Burkholderiales bacterium]|nr:MmgE/PrpD family protein [Burkholderiales bacterium]